MKSETAVARSIVEAVQAKRRKRTNPESKGLKAIVDALRARGHTVLRIHSGKLQVRHYGRTDWHWMQLADEGTPDLCLPFLGAWGEVKREGAKLSPAQIEWHAKARAAGVRVAVWRSAADAVRDAEAWKRADEHERVMGWR